MCITFGDSLPCSAKIKCLKQQDAKFFWYTVYCLLKLDNSKMALFFVKIKLAS